MPVNTPRPPAGESAEPDDDPSVPALRESTLGRQSPVLAAVAVGGGLGAAARYAATLWWPNAPTGFPVSLLAVNVAGCAAIGVFMVLVSEVWTSHRLLRPFVGTGVLGGFTTFSAYAENVDHLLSERSAVAGVTYLGLTLVAALAAVWSAAAVTRGLLLRGRRRQG
ncbi:fluoride efflux transporter FluC [Streptomyces sparsus]